MNLNELREARATAVAQNGLTLKDLIGQTAVLPLPAGLSECRIVDVPSTENSKSLRIVVERDEINDDGEVITKKYSININLGPTAESASMFMTNVSHLLDQLGLSSLDLKALKEKKGETIVVLGVDRMTLRGTFTNYIFNPAIMAAALESEEMA